jgi:hypothetical protein
MRSPKGVHKQHKPQRAQARAIANTSATTSMPGIPNEIRTWGGSYNHTMGTRGITAKAILVCAATGRVVVMDDTNVRGQPIPDLPGGKWDLSDGYVAPADPAGLRACAFRTVRREIVEELPGLDVSMLAVVGAKVFSPPRGKGWALFLIVAPRIPLPLAVSSEHTGARLVSLRKFRIPRRWLRIGALGAWLTVAGPQLIMRYAAWCSAGRARDLGVLVTPVREQHRGPRRSDVHGK